MKRTYTQAQRDEALALYKTDGPTAVQHELGILKGTVTRWAKAAGVETVSSERNAAAVEAASLQWAERRAGIVAKFGHLADVSVTRAITEANDGSTSKAKDLATTAAIAVDKAQLLDGDVTQRTEYRQARAAVLDQAREQARHLRSVPAA